MVNNLLTQQVKISDTYKFIDDVFDTWIVNEIGESVCKCSFGSNEIFDKRVEKPASHVIRGTYLIMSFKEKPPSPTQTDPECRKFRRGKRNFRIYNLDKINHQYQWTRICVRPGDVLHSEP